LIKFWIFILDTNTAMTSNNSTETRPARTYMTATPAWIATPAWTATPA
jgi:hypothetical protein